MREPRGERREGVREGARGRKANCKNHSAKHNNTYNSIMYTDIHRLSLYIRESVDSLCRDGADARIA